LNAKASHIAAALNSPQALARIPEPWPAIYPSRAQLTTAYTEFKATLMAAADGGRIAVSARNQKQAALIKILKDLAPYLEGVAKAAQDVTILELTGYDRWRPRTPTPSVLPGPVLKLRRGRLSGVLIADATCVPGAGSYEIQYCLGNPGDEANWRDGSTTTRCARIHLTGLTPGQVYSVRVRAIGRSGPGAWSNLRSLMAV
jgi:hypothetical protein